MFTSKGAVDVGVVSPKNFHNGYDVEIEGITNRISGDNMIKCNAFNQGEDVI